MDTFGAKGIIFPISILIELKHPKVKIFFGKNKKDFIEIYIFVIKL